MTELNKPPPKSLAEKWDDLPKGAKAGVGIGAAAVAVMGIAGFIVYCVRQRRKGRLERALGETQYNPERTEMSDFQGDWKQSEFRHKGYQQVN